MRVPMFPRGGVRVLTRTTHALMPRVHVPCRHVLVLRRHMTMSVPILSHHCMAGNAAVGRGYPLTTRPQAQHVASLAWVP